LFKASISGPGLALDLGEVKKNSAIIASRDAYIFIEEVPEA